MKLSAAQLRSVISGAERVWEENGLVLLRRFTEAQEALYKTVSPDYYDKARSSAGMCLRFRTDSRSLFLSIVTGRGSSRSYFSCDVFVNGEPTGCLDNYSHEELPENYTTAVFPMGEFSKEFPLGDGVKTVCLYLPWSVSVAIRELSLEDGAFVEPMRREKKLLVFGDSITQGYDALRPSRRYAAALADALEAEETNKAIGGEVFRPALAQLPDGFAPDYVLVAYGTNDWSKKEAPAIRDDCRAFYQTVAVRYPAARIFALTPVWRADCGEYRPCGPFAAVEAMIRDAAEGLNNVTVVRGFRFVPEDTSYFSDRYLHPNDAGFAHYAKSLCAAVREVM